MITQNIQEELINSLPQLKDLIAQFNQSYELLESLFKGIPSDNIAYPEMVETLRQIQFIMTQCLSNAINEFFEQLPEFNRLPNNPELLHRYQNILWHILEKYYLKMLADKNFQNAFAALINNAALHYHPHKLPLSDKITIKPTITFDECAKTIIYQKDRVTLYRYTNLAPQRFRTPILIVYALVNRPSILDLQPDRSLIKELLLAGFDIYLIDWGYPTDADNKLSLNDYLSNYLKHSIKQICQLHKVQSLNLIGVCQGGIMSLCYSALNPKQVKNLITMVTPVEFHSPENILGQLLQSIDIDLVVNKWGNIPGIYLAQCLLNLRPFRLLHDKYQPILRGTATADQLSFFTRMEYWLHDCPDHPKELFREFIKEFYQKNKLINNKLVIGKKSVNLKNINMPVLNIYAHDDHLVPLSSTKPLEYAISSTDYQQLEFNSGHIGVFVSHKALHEIPKAIIKWLEKRDVQKK